jgi:predicted nucleotidyltransferase
MVSFSIALLSELLVVLLGSLVSFDWDSLVSVEVVSKPADSSEFFEAVKKFLKYLFKKKPALFETEGIYKRSHNQDNSTKNPDTEKRVINSLFLDFFECSAILTFLFF